MSTYATAADVQAVLGRELDDAETALVERRLEQVERMILRRVPDLAGQIADGTIDQADVVDIEAEAVLRVVRNPDCVFMESDGSYTYTKSAEAADGSLRITAEEWKLLGIKPSRMFQIVPARGGVPL
ncbi:Gp19/Gp15/Gp42 family protein [[Mycobacterium] nativiensis]|uniref:Gp19/Gp15/Gp42 family protein n=1 Tax=[Mycobacterium] nativiensis TaxID=2855503 RepID=A0ABU5XSX5_9MYCO|nr:Gp19/Gp15/Gp42 family protein [Mycolicibacter sp. MYC340]MEB3031081.1 Gp19/Gp15/Gp42 family protein [Mycolicibacter sp. MYC340]